MRSESGMGLIGLLGVRSEMRPLIGCGREGEVRTLIRDSSDDTEQYERERNQQDGALTNRGIDMGSQHNRCRIVPTGSIETFKAARRRSRSAFRGVFGVLVQLVFVPFSLRYPSDYHG